MFEISIWMIWAVVGTALVVAEMFTVTFFLVCLGIGAFASAVAASLGLGITVQWMIFIAISSASVIASKRLSDRQTATPPTKTNVDRLIGKEGVVIKRISSGETGKVKVQHEEWLAETKVDLLLHRGERVKIISLQGTHLIVEKKV